MSRELDEIVWQEVESPFWDAIDLIEADGIGKVPETELRRVVDTYRTVSVRAFERRDVMVKELGLPRARQVRAAAIAELARRHGQG